MKDDERDAYYREASNNSRHMYEADARDEREFLDLIADQEEAAAAALSGLPDWLNPSFDRSATMRPNNTSWMEARGD